MRFVTLLLVVCTILSGCIVTVDGTPPKKVNYAAAANSYLKLGVAYMQKKRYDLAEPKLLRSIKLSPNAEAYNALALLYEEQHNQSLAEKTYQTLIEDFPDYARGYWNYGIFLCKNQRDAQLNTLVANMAKLTKMDQSSAMVLGQVISGECALHKQDYRQARTFFKTALRYDSDNAVALMALANMEFQQGLLTQAQEKVDRFHNRVGYSPKSLQLAIRLAKKMNQGIVAKKMKAILIRDFPHSPQAKRLLGKL